MSFFITTRHASWRVGQQRSSSTLSVNGQLLDDDPVVVHVLHFRFHSFFARLSSVDHASASRLGSGGWQLFLCECNGVTKFRRE